MNNSELIKSGSEEVAARYLDGDACPAATNVDMETLTDPGFIARMQKCAERTGSVNALARKAGLSQSGIRRYFNGGDPTRKVLIAIANAAGVRFLWLATGEEPMLPEEASMPPSVLRPEILRLAIETVEEALVDTGRLWSAERKAEIVAAAYELFMEGGGKIAKSVVLRLVRSAA